MVKKKKWTSDELRKHVQHKYSDTQRYAVMHEVAQGTGRWARSWIDVAVFHLWPSDGCSRIAMEIKVSRQDFLNELKRSAKNKWAKENFHEFWYVAPSDVIKEEELPEGCGWLKPHGEGLSIVRHAAHKDIPAVTDTLLASFIRSAACTSQKSEADMRRQVLQTSPEHKDACMWQKAAEAFLSSRGERHVFVENAEAAQLAIENAATDPVAKKERDHVFAVLDGFQTRLVDMLELFELLAYGGIMAKDEAGEYMADVYSTPDPSSIAAMQKRLKSGKTYRKDKIKQLLGWLEALGVEPGNKEKT